MELTNIFMTVKLLFYKNLYFNVDVDSWHVFYVFGQPSDDPHSPAYTTHHSVLKRFLQKLLPEDAVLLQQH